MLYTKKFVFTVSLCAMLAVNPVLAVTDPVSAVAGAKSGTPGVVSTVYSDWAGRANSGIAGVTYVNSAVDAAGNAAQWAENHAAAAAQSAKSAADSAAQAASKVSIDQGADNKNKAMVTDDAGSVYAGYITNDMVATAENEIGKPLLSWSGKARWAQVDSGGIADGAVTMDKIAYGAVTVDKLSVNGEPSYSGFLAYTGNAGLEMMGWRLVGTDDIADGAVTADKIAADSLNLVGEVLQTKSGASGLYTDWGQIITQGIASGAVTTNKIADGAISLKKMRYINTYASGIVSDGIPLTTDGSTGLVLSQISSVGIADGAVTSGKIANGAVMADKIGADTSAISVGPATQSLLYAYETGDGSVIMNWGQIRSAGIADGAVTENKIADKAVTIDKTAGVVGMVPVGSADATTYGQFWIE